MSDERSAYRRVRRVLNKHRIIMVAVGGRVSEDRVIGEFIERDGATVSNPEYAAITREIARAARK